MLFLGPMEPKMIPASTATARCISPMNLCQLPFELVHDILSYCDACTLLRLAQTSRLLHTPALDVLFAAAPDVSFHDENRNDVDNEAEGVVVVDLHYNPLNTPSELLPALRLKLLLGFRTDLSPESSPRAPLRFIFGEIHWRFAFFTCRHDNDPRPGYANTVAEQMAANNASAKQTKPKPSITDIGTGYLLRQLGELEALLAISSPSLSGQPNTNSRQQTKLNLQSIPQPQVGKLILDFTRLDIHWSLDRDVQVAMVIAFGGEGHMDLLAPCGTLQDFGFAKAWSKGFVSFLDGLQVGTLCIAGGSVLMEKLHRLGERSVRMQFGIGGGRRELRMMQEANEKPSGRDILLSSLQKISSCLLSSPTSSSKAVIQIPTSQTPNTNQSTKNSPTLSELHIQSPLVFDPLFLPWTKRCLQDSSSTLTVLAFSLSLLPPPASARYRDADKCPWPVLLDGLHLPHLVGFKLFCDTLNAISNTGHCISFCDTLSFLKRHPSIEILQLDHTLWPTQATASASQDSRKGWMRRRGTRSAGTDANTIPPTPDLLPRLGYILARPREMAYIMDSIVLSTPKFKLGPQPNAGPGLEKVTIRPTTWHHRRAAPTTPTASQVNDDENDFTLLDQILISLSYFPQDISLVVHFDASQVSTMQNYFHRHVSWQSQAPISTSLDPGKAPPTRLQNIKSITFPHSLDDSFLFPLDTLRVLSAWLGLFPCLEVVCWASNPSLESGSSSGSIDGRGTMALPQCQPLFDFQEELAKSCPGLKRVEWGAYSVDLDARKAKG